MIVRNRLLFRIPLIVYMFAVGILLCGVPLYSAPMAKLKQELSISNGLAHNGVTSMLRDTKGYLWIGTYDGLCRYNGKQTTVFKNKVDSRILNSNRVRALCEDAQGTIWIGTDVGLSVFSYDSYQFKRLPLPEGYQGVDEWIVRSLSISKDGDKVFAAIEGVGVFVYDTTYKLLYSTTEMGVLSISGCAAQLSGDVLLLPTSSGVVLYDDSDKSTSMVLPNIINDVWEVSVLDETTIAVMLEHGLYLVNYSVVNGSYVFELASDLLYADSQFSSLQVDEDGMLWIGTDTKGFACMPHYRETLGKSDLEYINDDLRISSFLFLDDGTKWVSSFDKGMFRYSTDGEVFTSIKSLGDIKQCQIVQLDRDRLLVQPYFRDLCMIDVVSGNRLAMPSGLSEEDLRSPSYLLPTSRGDVWVFKNERKVFRLKGDAVLPVSSDKLGQLPQWAVPTAAGVDGSGNLWLGYSDNLYRMSLLPNGDVASLETIHLNPIFNNYNISKVRVVYWDEESRSLWIGTDSQGLYRIVVPSKESLIQANITHYTFEEGDIYSLPSNFVSSIMRHPNGELWIGTEQGGVCRMIENEEGNVIFENFTEQAQLTNDVVKSFVVDTLNRMWVATNVGLHLYDDAKNSFLNFYDGDGLPFEDFWYSSISVKGSDRLYFTGVQGICSFDAKRFPAQDELPNIEFSGISIFDRVVRPYELVDGDVVFAPSSTNGDKVQLHHKQSGITVQVDALYGSHSSNHRIRYQLLPMSDMWQTLPSHTNSISLSGLSPRVYTLRVVASDALLNWTAAKELTIMVSPPWWRTPFAYTIYAMLLLLIIIGIVRILMRFQQLNHNLEIEALEKRNLESINEEKQRYFSNISHELKTPLTLIFAPLESLMQQFRVDTEVRKKLHIIKRQSRKMLGLIDLAHNVQLNEMNMLKRDVSQFDFVRFMQSVTADFTFLAEYDNKQLLIEQMNDESVFVEADKSMIEKVVNNLLNNSFKYTRPEDTIRVRYGVVNGVLQLHISDTGYGIDESDLPHIFDRFYQGRHHAENVGGTGIGLTFSRRLVLLHGGNIEAQSKLGAGTTFIVMLPIVIPMPTLAPTESEENTPTIDSSEPSFIIGECELESKELSKELRDSTLFVVEDNAELRQFMFEFLSPYFNVEMFANGVECMEQMKERWPSLIISDVMMPEMDGYELCKRVKSDIKTSHIPFILLTALTTVDDKIKGLEHGADAYIPKPFYPKHLFKRIETLLRGRVALRERYQVGIPIVLNDSKGTATKDNEFLEKLYNLFSKNLDNDEVDVYSFAVELGLNRSFFLQKVKALTNCSPYELLKNYRLTEAAKLLLAKSVNVNEVCYMTGFKSRTHFSRLFKEKYGVSPSKYGMEDV